MSTLHLRTSVAIIGGGPAGLMLAIELGCRGVACVVLEEDADAPLPPKANATSARTMEHYRRRGFADAVRAVGLTEDHPQADEVPDPHALPLRTLVNGELRQSASTALLIYNVWQQIEYLSTVMTLEPGDVLATGTCAGVGIAMKPQRFLAPGDVVRVEIDGVGTIENRFVAEPV